MTLAQYQSAMSTLRQDFHRNMVTLLEAAKADGHSIDAVMKEGSSVPPPPPPPPVQEFDL